MNLLPCAGASLFPGGLQRWFVGLVAPDCHGELHLANTEKISHRGLEASSFQAALKHRFVIRLIVNMRPQDGTSLPEVGYL